MFATSARHDDGRQEDGTMDQTGAPSETYLARALLLVNESRPDQCGIETGAFDNLSLTARFAGEGL